VVDFIDLRSIQSADISGETISRGISARFNAKISPTSVNIILHNFHLKYQANGYTQDLIPTHVVDRISFREKNLLMPDVLPNGCFSDESQIVIRNDEQ
jgi:hypothetical protein